MKTLYKVKGLGTEQTIASKIKIYTEGEKITKVEDRWNDSLPEGAFANVSVLSVRSWLYYGQSWVYWGWSLCWETWWWRVRLSRERRSVFEADNMLYLNIADFRV